MYREALSDQLRQIEREVVEGERQLAEQEAHLFALKQAGGWREHGADACSALLRRIRNAIRRAQLSHRNHELSHVLRT